MLYASVQPVWKYKPDARLSYDNQFMFCLYRVYKMIYVILFTARYLYYVLYTFQILHYTSSTELASLPCTKYAIGLKRGFRSWTTTIHIKICLVHFSYTPIAYGNIRRPTIWLISDALHIFSSWVSAFFFSIDNT